MHHRETDGLLQFLKGLYHPLVLADVIRRAIYWFVIAKVQLPASFLTAQVTEAGGHVAKQLISPKAEIIFQLRALQGAHRPV